MDIDNMEEVKLFAGTILYFLGVIYLSECWLTQISILVGSIIGLSFLTGPKMKSCESTNRLENKVVVVTGGNTGIGKETVLEMVRRGARVITGCRDLNKAQAVVTEVRDKYGADLVVEHLDLADLESVKKFAVRCNQEERLDILVNNAGLMMPKGGQTKQGFEIHFGVNYLGHYLLTELLYPLLSETGTEHQPSRVVNVASDGYKFTLWHGLDVSHPFFGESKWAYKGVFAAHRLYGQSKLAQMYHARELSRVARERGENVIAVSLHPGAVSTEITRYHAEGLGQVVTSLLEGAMARFGRTPLQGAQTTLHCCLTDAGLLTPGGFYNEYSQLVDSGDYRMNNWYTDIVHQKNLARVSDRMVADFK